MNDRRFGEMLEVLVRNRREQDAHEELGQAFQASGATHVVFTHTPVQCDPELTRFILSETLV